jgi:hypothetical protein
MSAQGPRHGIWLRLGLVGAAAAGFALAWLRYDKRQASSPAAEPLHRGGAMAGRGFDAEFILHETLPAAPEPVAINPRPLLIAAVLALIGMAAFLVWAPKSAAGGWLIAFVFWSGIPIGSVVALMIHTLTGGHWGHRFAAVFVPTAAAVPLIAVLLIPMLAVPGAFYSWIGGSGGAAPDVAHLYLNTPFYIGRSLIALAGWALLGLLLPRLAGTPALLLAGGGLVFHGFIIGVIGLDWILSVEPPFVSTSFGASLAFTQLASAFAWALVLAPGTHDDTGVGDLGGLLLATLLGITYVNFMALLVIWYGDLPHRVIWFVHRDHFPWTLIGGLAFVFGSVVPIFALFLARIRGSRTALRSVGAITLAGIALYDAYLVAPAFGTLALGAALFGIVAMGALLTVFSATAGCQPGFYRWRATRGR